MPATTPTLAIPYAVDSDPADVPTRMQENALAVEGLIVADRARLTSLEGGGGAVLTGTLAARPAAAGNARKYYLTTDTGDLYVSDGATWRRVHLDGDTTMRFAWNFTLPGEIKVASGATDFLPSAAIAVPSGQSVNLVGYKWTLQYGTSFTFNLTHWRTAAGATVLNSGIVAAAASYTGGGTFTPKACNDGDVWYPVISAVSGTPSGGTIAILADVTV